jgi:photosystem II stability/assembly factor-like uncharacterized protein
MSPNILDLRKNKLSNRNLNKNFRASKSKSFFINLVSIALIIPLIISSFIPLISPSPADAASWLWTPQTALNQRTWTSVSASDNGSKLAAINYYGHIYISNNGGDSWNEYSALGSDKNWNAINVSDDGSKMAAGGYYSNIYTSIDGGNNWIMATSSGQKIWKSITSSSDGTKIFAAAENDHIYTSSDGGVTWASTTNGVTATWKKIESSDDGQHLVAITGNDWNEGDLYLSHNGGTTWATTTTAGQGGSATISADGTKIALAKSFYRGSYGYIYISNDGGDTWEEKTGSGSKKWTHITSSEDGTKLAASAGFMNGTYGYIYTSNNGGDTWTEQTEAGARNWSSLKFSGDGSKLIASTIGGNVYLSIFSSLSNIQNSSPTQNATTITWQSDEPSSSKVYYGTSTNYGLETTEQNISPRVTNHSVTLSGLTACTTYNYKISSTDANNVVSQSGNLSFITAGCPHWEWTERTNAGLKNWGGVDISPDAVNITASNYYGYTYTSNDSGDTWVENTQGPQGSAPSTYMNSVATALNGQKIFATKYNDYIHISNDGGSTWSTSTSVGQYPWYQIDASEDGQIVGAITSQWSGTSQINISKDGGTTWASSSNAGTRNWSDIAISADGSKLVAAPYFSNGSYGHIYTSNNQGDTWTAQTGSPQIGWLTITASANGTKLAAGANSGPIYTSSDGGSTWVARLDSGSYAWQDITSSADGNVIAAIGYGYIHVSRDGGETWEVDNSFGGSKQWKSIKLSADGNKMVAVIGGATGYIYTGTYVVPEIITPTPEPTPTPTPTSEPSNPPSSGSGIMSRSGGGSSSNTNTNTPVQPNQPNTPPQPANCPSGMMCTPNGADQQGTGTNLDAPATIAATVITTTPRNLSIGTRGIEVKSLQTFLNAAGYVLATVGPGSPGNETTIFGALTQRALAAFQRANGITPSVGFFGPKTKAFIQALIQSN